MLIGSGICELTNKFIEIPVSLSSWYSFHSLMFDIFLNYNTNLCLFQHLELCI